MNRRSNNSHMPRPLFISLLLFLALLPLSAQDLESVLEAHQKAAAWEKMEMVETIITTGKNTYSMAGFESGFTIFQSRPNKLRVEGNYQGSKVIQTFDGTTGWKYAPAMGVTEPVKISGPELETLLSQLQFESPLWNYKEKSASLELAGQESNSEHHLVLTNADGDVQHFFINRENHLITRMRTRQMLGGSETEIEVLVTDYKPVKGIPFARHVVTKMNGQVVTTLQIDKVEINRVIDHHMFEKPATE